jgi:hypothetical protein
MYQDYLNCPWPLSVRLQGKLLSSFNNSANIKIFNSQGPNGYMWNVVYKEVLEM